MSLRRDATLLTRAAASGVVRSSAPYKLTVALTWVCDQRCTHCAIWKRRRSDELDAGEWRRVWRSARDHLSWLDLTGGEVTTRHDVVEIAVAASEKWPELALLHFPSNGRRPAVVERVASAVERASKARLIVSLSLDGPESTHDELRGDVGSFTRTVETFERLRRRGIECYFGMTLSPYNRHLLEETFVGLSNRIPTLRWSDLHVNFLHVSEHYFDNAEVPTNEPEALRDVIEDFVRRRGAPSHPTHLLEHLYLRHVPAHLASGRSPIPCASLSGNAFINPSGQVYPCHIWDRPIASLRRYEYSLPAIWDLPETRRLRAEIEADRCPGCWTPCEAYPSILSSLPRAVLGSS